MGMLKILVVDDDPFVRELLNRQLQCDHHHVLAVASAQMAIAALDDAAFDLLISDIMMPGGNGTHLMQYVRTMHPHMKILAITGGFTNRDCTYKLWADRYADCTLMKPVPLAKLLEVVAALGRTPIAAPAPSPA